MQQRAQALTGSLRLDAGDSAALAAAARGAALLASRIDEALAVLEIPESPDAPADLRT